MITIASGIWLTGFLPILPGIFSSAAPVLCALLAALVIRRRLIALPLAFLAGVAFADYSGSRIIAGLLSPSLDTQQFQVRGRVSGLPVRSVIRGVARLRFDLDVASASCVDPAATGTCAPPLRKLRLSWYQQDLPVLMPGQLWTFRVKLRRPRGYVNPVGFRYGDWLVQQGYSASGYVVGDAGLIETSGRGIHTLRYRLREALTQLAAASDHLRFIRALALADRSALEPEDWQRFADTGTSHLLAISGLHIGIAAGVGAALGAIVRRAAGLTGLWAVVSSAAPALLLAAFYSAMAGWALPTQRAFCMVAVATMALSLRRQISALNGLAAALLAVLLIDPLAGFSAGFYLSFSAVVLILLVTRGWRQRDRLQLRPQWAIFLGMTPLLIVIFGALPLATLPANLVSIPLYTFLIVPLLLLALVLLPLSAGLSGYLLDLIDAALGLQQRYLALLQAVLPAPLQVQAPEALFLVALSLALLVMLLPRAVPGRIPAAVILAVSLYVSIVPRPAPEGVTVTVLDVGQGMSVFMRAGRETLVYDVGPAYSEAFDTGSAFLLPLLRADKVRRADTLLISHADSDHAGSLPQVLSEIAPRRILFGERPVKYLPAHAAGEHCHRGQRWSLGPASVDVLHPQPGQQAGGNNASCVLRVEFAGVVILLPGDIEKAAERSLMATEPVNADVILAPHHGSKTSSSPAFVAAVRPRHVIYSAGWRHHFGHPHPAVKARWREQASRAWSTAEQGAISLHISADGALSVFAQRLKNRRYWQLPN